MANTIEITAKVTCHLKGIFPAPLIIITPIAAVIKKDNKVIMPKYIIRGFPKIKK